MRELSELPWPAPVGQLEEEHPTKEQGDPSPWTQQPPPPIPCFSFSAETLVALTFYDQSCCPASVLPPSWAASRLHLQHLHLFLPLATAGCGVGGCKHSQPSYCIRLLQEACMKSSPVNEGVDRVRVRVLSSAMMHLMFNYKFTRFNFRKVRQKRSK